MCFCPHNFGRSGKQRGSRGGGRSGAARGLVGRQAGSGWKSRQAVGGQHSSSSSSWGRVQPVGGVQQAAAVGTPLGAGGGTKACNGWRAQWRRTSYRGAARMHRCPLCRFPLTLLDYSLQHSAANAADSTACSPAGPRDVRALHVLYRLPAAPCRVPLSSCSHRPALRCAVYSLTRGFAVSSQLQRNTSWAEGSRRAAARWLTLGRSAVHDPASRVAAGLRQLLGPSPPSRLLHVFIFQAKNNSRHCCPLCSCTTLVCCPGLCACPSPCRPEPAPGRSLGPLCRVCSQLQPLTCCPRPPREGWHAC